MYWIQIRQAHSMQEVAGRPSVSSAGPYREQTFIKSWVEMAHQHVSQLFSVAAGCSEKVLSIQSENNKGLWSLNILSSINNPCWMRLHVILNHVVEWIWTKMLTQLQIHMMHSWLIYLCRTPHELITTWGPQRSWISLVSLSCTIMRVL